MKNKSPLMLIEQILMVLVFALAAAFCLQAFVLSEQISLEGERRGEAAALAQNAAETLKSCGGDYEAAAKILGGSWDGAAWTAEQSGMHLAVCPQPSGVPGLGKAAVSVTNEAGETLFTLPAAWQEVS